MQEKTTSSKLLIDFNVVSIEQNKIQKNIKRTKKLYISCLISGR